MRARGSHGRDEFDALAGRVEARLDRGRSGTDGRVVRSGVLVTKLRDHENSLGAAAHDAPDVTKSVTYVRFTRIEAQKTLVLIDHGQLTTRVHDEVVDGLADLTEHVVDLRGEIDPRIQHDHPEVEVGHLQPSHDEFSVSLAQNRLVGLRCWGWRRNERDLRHDVKRGL